MSADLFAEFSQPATNSIPPKQQQQHQQQQLSNPQSPFSIQNTAQNKPAPVDPLASFDISNNNKQYSPSTSSIQWPSAQPQQHQHQQSTFASPWAPQPASFSAPHTNQQPATPEDDDGWGDFEVAETSNHPPNAVSPSNVGGWASPSPSLPQQTTTDPYSQFSSGVFTPTTSLSTNINFPRASPGPFAQAAPKTTVSKPKQLVSSKAADPNVLFDAEDFELDGGEDDDGFDDDDDFGDFETVQAAPSQPSKPKPPVQPSYNMPSMDLLSLDEPEPAVSTQVVAAAPLKQGSGLKFGALSRDGASSPTKPISHLAASMYDTAKKPVTKAQTSQTAKSKPQVKSTDKSLDAWGGDDFDESWSAWDDDPANTTQTTQPKKTAAQNVKTEPENWDWDSSPADVASTVDDNSPPPVNVPPPSIILSTFPELFKLAEPLFKSTTGQNAATKQQILSNPKTVEFLRGYILLATTAGRVIAGRKQRWHRDKILAKSMSISAAGSKGMKLAGVDKTQSVREDREAADVAAAWKEHVGRLRSAVAVANSSAQANLKVPELNETMPVQTAKVVPTAPKPCVICGLKRDERVSKLDFEVEDSFGEWWVEHWGHRACKNFWVEHEKQLRQR